MGHPFGGNAKSKLVDNIQVFIPKITKKKPTFPPTESNKYCSSFKPQ